MDKVREEFEKECLASMNSLYFKNEDEKKVYLNVDSDNNYVHDCTRLAYLWFVKGRETIVVKLPEESAIWWFDEVCDALDDAGVKYE